MLLQSFFAISLHLSLAFFGVFAYIPASPTNVTEDAIAAGLNVTDVSKLYLQWYPRNSYFQNVAYQLIGQESQGITKGALVHFSENNVNDLTPATSTPWIALVSCDFNATDASQEVDIFTLARDKGAGAALLYSLYSEACIINPEYADPETFEQVFDIFSTQSRISANLIESQFNESFMNRDLYSVYDSQRLNDSFGDIASTIDIGYPVAPGFMFAILRAYNATVSIINDTNSGGGSSTSTSGSSGKSPNTTLAMIILYAITGCVSVLFCLVIITGAIRAIRHPERYGPRARGGEGGDGAPQSRARGLTRAILDTFPIVKFGSSTQNPHGVRSPGKDMEAPRDSDDTAIAVELTVAGAGKKAPPSPTPDRPSPSPGQESSSKRNEKPPRHSTSSSDARSPPPAEPPSPRQIVSPESMGLEVCPICIVEFEEGDDLRVLPCEGKHRFHPVCVDPWLLELSSMCPLCRQDFQTLENILSGSAEGHNAEEGNPTPSPSPSPRNGNGGAHHSRFSRYLRFAHHRRAQTSERRDSTAPHPPISSATPPV